MLHATLYSTCYIVFYMLHCILHATLYSTCYTVFYMLHCILHATCYTVIHATLYSTPGVSHATITLMGYIGGSEADLRDPVHCTICCLLPPSRVQGTGTRYDNQWSLQSMVKPFIFISCGERPPEPISPKASDFTGKNTKAVAKMFLQYPIGPATAPLSRSVMI